MSHPGDARPSRAPAGIVPFDVAANRQVDASRRTAIEHEVVRLLEELAPTKPPARRGAPATAVTAYRWPNRCILQGSSRAISITWFPGRRDHASFGELLVITWQGTVSRPGSGEPRGEQAVVVSQRLLHPEATAVGDWTWHTAADDVAGLGVCALAALCRDELEPPGSAATGT